jgi:hypothetical protein
MMGNLAMVYGGERKAALGKAAESGGTRLMKEACFTRSPRKTLQ